MVCGKTLWLGSGREDMTGVYWAGLMNSWFSPKCHHFKVLLPSWCCSRKPVTNQSRRFWTFSKVFQVYSSSYLPIIKTSITCFKALNILSSALSMTHHTGNTDILPLLPVPFWTELQDYHQHMRIFTHGWCRGKQKAKIWIYYTLIYGPMIHSRLGLRAGERAFRQPHFQLPCQSISYLI